MPPAADPDTLRPVLPAFVARLPGPDRKRAEAAYHYRLTYRNPLDDACGCVMIWEVSGGRLPYQIALEREESGDLRVHCTCADAIFRAEAEGRVCKHVQGLLRLRRDAAAEALEVYCELGA